VIKLLSLPDALPSARPRTEVRPEEGITVPVLVVTDPATTLVNRFCRQLHQAYRLRLATDPRVRLFEVASLAQLATVAHAQRPTVIVNLSRHPVAALQQLLPPWALVVDFVYREADAVQVPLSRLAGRPLFIPGLRAVLRHPSTAAVTAFLHRGGGGCEGTIGQWEWRSHHKVAGRLRTALLTGSFLVLDCFLGALHDGVAPESYGALRHVPEPREVPPAGGKLVTLTRYAWHLVQRTARLRLAPDFREQWSVGVARVPESAGGRVPDLSGTPAAVQWLIPSADRIFADPHLAAHEGQRTLFFEEKVGDAPGMIMAAPVADDGTVQMDARVTALRTDFHLSFPFVVEHEGAPYLLPEQAATWRVVLYRCIRFPTRWEPWVVLLDGFQGADPVLHHHEGHWYLFVSDATHGNHDNHLQLFVAPTIAGPFRRHPASPVRFGLRGSRMAGALRHTPEGLVRLGQECHELYGGSISAFLVEALTPTTYRERFLRRLPPIPGDFPMAMHTHSALEGLVAVDGRRMIPRALGGTP
jgi:hypothetical protein